MTELLFDVSAFSLKALVLGLVVFGGLLMIIAASLKNRQHQKDLEVEDLTEKTKSQVLSIKSKILPPKEFKKLVKAEQKIAKQEKKQSSAAKGRLFVLSFEGDVKASQVEALREQVNALISICEAHKDQVLICIESPGGMVHTYGLAAAQIHRLRTKGIHVIASVDKVAASGGYLMAAVAKEIIAAPFAVLGSIGVVAQVPNLHRLLKKHDVDYEEVTSGKYKRSVSLLGEITEDGRKHFEKKIEGTHVLFKSFVKDLRPNLNMDEVANGDHWYGTEAVELGLVDRIQTSDDFILDAIQTMQVIRIKSPEPKNVLKKLAQVTMDKALTSLGLLK